MTYERFEDLPVWRLAAELYQATEEFQRNGAFKATTGFRAQLDRAALSVSNNIAEGFDRGTTKELLQFLYIARGSAGEVRSMLTVKLGQAAKDRWPEPLRAQVLRLIALADSCSRQLRGWAESLQNSEIPGRRYLNTRSRQEEQDRKRAETFRRELLRKLPLNNPLRKDAEERGLI